MKEAILLLQCPDKIGIVASLSTFLLTHHANIISLDQYSTDHQRGDFFTRIAFCYQPKKVTYACLKKGMKVIGNDLNAYWQLYKKEEKRRFAILVSKEAHCLNELLHRWGCSELDIDITAIISNAPIHKKLVHHYKLPFHYIPASTKDRKEAEILSLVKGKTEGLILARYMQILSADFLSSYAKDIINIHHSFLPSFKGANPYQQAMDRGVKIIGATSHFVTEELDEGPLIMQGVRPVSHRDSVTDLKRQGRTLEQSVLAETVQLYSQHRILKFGHKTIVF